LAAALIILPGVYLGLFGSSFHSGVTAVVIVACAQLVNAAAGPTGTVLIMTGKERIAVRGVAAGLLANVVLAVVLVPLLGVTGGAIAFAVSLALWNIILVVIARRLVGINVTAFGWLSMQSTATFDPRVV
jgi:O-antigen/teichoic acid export membrane protein